LGFFRAVGDAQVLSQCLANLRPVQPPEVGEVVAAGGLYRHYERVAA
jgi:hypothetical protein